MSQNINFNQIPTATSTILGRASAGTGSVEALSGTTLTSLLDVFASGTKGLAPPSGGGSVNFLRADGTWAPAGGGGYTAVTKSASYTEATTSGEVMILANLAAGFTITLPTAVGNTAKFKIKKILTTGTIIINTTGAQTIDGALVLNLKHANDFVAIQSTGANWSIVASNLDAISGIGVALRLGIFS